MVSLDTPQRAVSASPVRRTLAWRNATVADTITETATARTMIIGKRR